MTLPSAICASKLKMILVSNLKKILTAKLEIVHRLHLVSPEEKYKVLAFISFTSAVMSVSNPLSTCREVSNPLEIRAANIDR